LFPTTTPFFFHRKTGEEPALPGVAVKFTRVPVHTGLEEAVIDKVTGLIGVTVILIAVDTAGLPVMQFALEVRVHVIISLFPGT